MSVTQNITKTASVADKATSESKTVRVSLIPFTSGLIMFVYAFFWPEGYGHWLGSIVRAFRDASGI